MTREGRNTLPMNSTLATDLTQLLSSTDDGDDGIASAVMDGEMDIASAIEALGELDDAELKQELLSAAVLAGFTLLERRRKSDTAETDDTDAEAESTTIEVDSSDEEGADESDTESRSRLVTVPRLVLFALAVGVAYAAVKYRKGQSETTQATLDDVGADTADEDDEPAAEETDATASTDSLVDEDAEDAEAAEPAEAAGPESEDITTDVEDVDIDTDVEDEDVDTETEAVEEREPETTEAPEPEEEDTEDDEK
jgi:hypothetical protein